MSQATLLPKIGAPLRAMTPKQIDEERALYLATRYNVAHRARTLNVHRSTLFYHLGPVTGNGPRISPRVQNLIEAADALLAVAPKNEQGFYLRQAYVAARQALTRRKS